MVLSSRLSPISVSVQVRLLLLLDCPFPSQAHCIDLERMIQLARLSKNRPPLKYADYTFSHMYISTVGFETSRKGHCTVKKVSISCMLAIYSTICYQCRSWLSHVGFPVKCYKKVVFFYVCDSKNLITITGLVQNTCTVNSLQACFKTL